ncbi:hypothetical protein niasHT_038704 [Heterodera trifolii]|uniref:BTB/POZ domain-containing protein n=1 Tax=Heterodera trifolii TaxID=157864 RepID=A0ABD2I2T6_9BILA
MSSSSSSKEGNSIERMKHLLSSGEDADIHFLVGDGDGMKLLPAHKLILKHASDVFEAMFHFDSQKEKTENASADSAVVEVPDVDPEAFAVMLSFIYADDLSELDGDNAMAVLCAAKKYVIPRLVNECLQVPIPKLSNVFLAFAQTRLFDLEDFSHQCLRYICQNAVTLFKSAEFLQIDQKLLAELFELDQLVINNEYDIWKAALRWADEKCRQNAIECSSENRRAALGPALFKIRFPLIPTDAFVKEIVTSGILTNDEFVAVYQFHCYPNFCGVPGLCTLQFPWNARISDWNISMGSRGTLAMEIEKFSEFAGEEVENYRESEAVVSIKGFLWILRAKHNSAEENTEKLLEFQLYRINISEGEDEEWSCKCSATFRIVSQKCGTENHVGKLIDRAFGANSSHGFDNFISFAELLDPSRGFYDKNEDKVTLAIDVFVEEQNTDKSASSADDDDDDDPSKSNGTIVMEIDKLSEFAREICLSERSSEVKQIHGIPWKIYAEIKIEQEKNNGKYLDFSLWRYGEPQEEENEDTDWSCKCSATLRIVSQKKSGAEDFITKFIKTINVESGNCMEFTNFITFAELMDPDKGFYDSAKDKVTVVVDVNVQ